jgi:hypothetical protein
VINPSLFPYAAKNIWIPNPEWTYKTWEPYAKMVDEIWVKTHEAEKLFADWGVQTRYIGWTSIDKVQPEKKNYHKAIRARRQEHLAEPEADLVQAYMRIHAQRPESLQGICPRCISSYEPQASPSA